MPGLTLKCDPAEIIVATVPPSDKPTRVEVRTFMRDRRNGGPSYSSEVVAPKAVTLHREQVSGERARTADHRPDFDSGVDRNVRDLG